MLFIVGAAIQSLSSSVAWMVVGRSVIGAGVGAASFAVPLYLAEIAPAAHRGRLVTTNIVLVTLGQVVAYVIGWAFAQYGSRESGWRWMVGLGAVPAAAQSVALLFMPETPRWLVKMGRPSAARAVVRRISGNGPRTRRVAEAVVKEIEIEVGQEDEARRGGSRHANAEERWLGALRELLTVGRNRRALAIACLLQGLQQLCGFVSGGMSSRISAAWCLTRFLSQNTRTRSCTSRPPYSLLLGLASRP